MSLTQYFVQKIEKGASVQRKYSFSQSMWNIDMHTISIILFIEETEAESVKNKVIEMVTKITNKNETLKCIVPHFKNNHQTHVKNSTNQIKN